MELLTALDDLTAMRTRYNGDVTQWRGLTDAVARHGSVDLLMDNGTSRADVPEVLSGCLAVLPVLGRLGRLGRLGTLPCLLTCSQSLLSYVLIGRWTSAALVQYPCTVDRLTLTSFSTDYFRFNLFFPLGFDINRNITSTLPQILFL